MYKSLQLQGLTRQSQTQKIYYKMSSSFLLIFSINIILPEGQDLQESQRVFNIITKYFCSLQKLRAHKNCSSKTNICHCGYSQNLLQLWSAYK